MRDAATAFLATLDAGQKTAATFPFTSEERETWFFTPVPRKGLAYFSMTDAQRAAAVKLLKTGLSAKGFAKVEAIRSLESVLYDIEGDAGKKPFVGGDGHPHRYPERYLFTIFGTPSATEPWGWRFEGHHISQNWTVVSGSAIASSPQFFGSNPAEVRTGPKTGLRVLAAEEDLARTLLQSLDETQRKAAMVNAEAPRDIFTMNKKKPERLPDVGIAYSALTTGQQQALWKLIEEYAFAQTATLGQARIAAIKKDGVDTIKFAWMGVRRQGRPALLPRPGRRLRHRVRQHAEQQQPRPRRVARLQRRLRPRHPRRALQGRPRLRGPGSPLALPVGRGPLRTARAASERAAAVSPRWARGGAARGRPATSAATSSPTITRPTTAPRPRVALSVAGWARSSQDRAAASRACGCVSPRWARGGAARGRPATSAATSSPTIARPTTAPRPGPAEPRRRRR